MKPEYRMPAEWAPHSGTLIAWPHNIHDWPGRFQPVPWVFADIVRQLHWHENVHILVKDATHEAKARRILIRVGVSLEAVRFHRIPTNRIWTRDTGPIFVLKEEGVQNLAGTNWRFNAWAKYSDWQLDDAVADHFLAAESIPEIHPVLGNAGRRIVLEGGSIDVNGSGVLLTTEECLLSEIQQRNPGLSRADYEQAFSVYLGVEKTIWLKNGIAGDDTHGHVDDLARFVNETTVIVVTENNPHDANYELLAENLALLQQATDQHGNRLEVVSVPLPSPVVFDGQRLPASYANFYIANGTVLVPTFNDPNDRIALGILQDLMPDRRVVGIHCLDLIWGLGAVHCMTQQIPKAGQS